MKLSCTVKITGDPEEIQEIQRFLRGKDDPDSFGWSVFCLRNVVPVPEEGYVVFSKDGSEREEVSDEFWMQLMWGSSSPALNAKTTGQDKDFLEFSFQSITGAPFLAFEELTKNFKVRLGVKWINEDFQSKLRTFGRRIYENGREVYAAGGPGFDWTKFLEEEFGLKDVEL